MESMKLKRLKEIKTLSGDLKTDVVIIRKPFQKHF